MAIDKAVRATKAGFEPARQRRGAQGIGSSGAANLKRHGARAAASTAKVLETEARKLRSRGDEAWRDGRIEGGQGAFSRKPSSSRPRPESDGEGASGVEDGYPQGHLDKAQMTVACEDATALRCGSARGLRRSSIGERGSRARSRKVPRSGAPVGAG